MNKNITKNNDFYNKNYELNNRETFLSDDVGVITWLFEFKKQGKKQGVVRIATKGSTGSVLFNFKTSYEKARQSARFLYGRRFGKTPIGERLVSYSIEYTNTPLFKKPMVENWRTGKSYIVRRDIKGRITKRTLVINQDDLNLIDGVEEGERLQIKPRKKPNTNFSGGDVEVWKGRRYVVKRDNKGRIVARRKA